MNNKRQHRRVPIERYVELITGAGKRIKTRSINLSVDGMAIMCPNAAKVGALFDFRFTLEYKDSLVPFMVRAQVKHVHIRGQQYYLGIQFQNLSEQQRTVIEHFVKEKEAIIQQNQYL